MTTDHRGDQRGPLPLRQRGLRAFRQLCRSALAPCSHGDAAAEKKTGEGGREGGERGLFTCCHCSPSPRHRGALGCSLGTDERSRPKRRAGRKSALRKMRPKPWHLLPWGHREPLPACAGPPPAHSTHSQHQGRGATQPAHLAPGKDTSPRLSPPAPALTQHSSHPEGNFCGEQLEEGCAEPGRAGGSPGSLTHRLPSLPPRGRWAAAPGGAERGCRRGGATGRVSPENKENKSKLKRYSRSQHSHHRAQPAGGSRAKP